MLTGTSLLLLAGANDMAVSIAVYDGPLIAAFGAAAFLIAIALEESARWGDEAKQLADLKATLEERVSERTSELSLTLEKLVRKDRLASLGRLAASVGHEINNPLTYVISNLELLKMDASDGQVDRIDDALEGSQRIAKIVSQLHVITKADDRAGWSSVDIDETIRTSVKTLHSKLDPLHRFDIESDQACFARGSKGRLTQLFVNLLSNAIESLPLDGQSKYVRINVEKLNADILVSIRDEGSGIPQEILQNLFEPFASNRPGGLGLGLTISKSIIDEVGGDIEIRSSGEGTEVRVSLPRCFDQSDSAISPVVTSKSVEKLRVLVIDDETLLLESMRSSLSKHDVTVSSSGLEAIELIRDGAYDVIFCDVVMPNTSGLDVFEQSIQFDRHIGDRFVFMSGGCPSDEVTNHISTTRARFLSKPFNISSIRSIVAEIVSGEKTLTEQPFNNDRNRSKF